MLTVAAWRHLRARMPERAELAEWVAEEGGEVVGAAEGLRRPFTQSGETGFVRVTVRSDRRGRGIGRELYDLAEAHVRALGCRRVATYFPETPESSRFAEAREFRLERVALQSSVDPRRADVSGLQRQPEGVRVLAHWELADRLEELFAVDLEAMQDEPQSEPVGEVRFEDWLDETWRQPMFSADGSFAVLDRDRIVSSASLYVDAANARARNGLTATLRGDRGRGLATLAKLGVLRSAAEQGIHTLWAANDETNAPMLAINRKLGYRTTARDVEMLRDL